MGGLFDDSLDEVYEDHTKEVLSKIKNPKKVVSSLDKQLRSKKISLEDKLRLITQKTLELLGRHRDDTILIKNKQDFIEFIDKAIDNGIIAFDTETNNSLDPITCKLMGLCLYTPGIKASYVPINHCDLHGVRLSWQLTEDDCREQVQRLIDAKVKFILHNGKFDFKVMLKTCQVAIPISWDTMVAMRNIDENVQQASLKWLYHTFVDSTHPVYDIDEVFPGVLYAYVDPEIFKLYAAVDGLMTFKLFEYEYDIITRPDQEGVYKLFREVESELPILVGDMELRGVQYNKEYSERLQKKYHY